VGQVGVHVLVVQAFEVHEGVEQAAALGIRGAWRWRRARGMDLSNSQACIPAKSPFLLTKAFW